mgnify:FL=1|jgi:hypothetical protein
MSESKYWELNDLNPDAVIFEEFIEAYLGYGTRMGMENPVAVYDARKMVKILAESFVADPEFVDKVDVNNREDLEEEAIQQAVEYIEFNYLGASFAENTPIFLYTYLF